MAYDAARHALNALLAEQGLRATSKGGHYAVQQAVRAQFGSVFAGFGALRRRRNELECPAFPDERAFAEEAQQAVDEVSEIVSSATRLLSKLRLF